MDWYCHLYLFLIESEVTSPMLFHETKDCLVLNTCFVTLPCGWKLLSGYPYVKYLSCHYCKSRLVVDVADPHWLKETYDLLPKKSSSIEHVTEKIMRESAHIAAKRKEG